MKSTDEAIAAVHTAGLMVNNLFQRANGAWQANLRGRDGICRHYGHGDTPATALREALGATPLRPAIPLVEPKPATAEDLL